MKMKSNDIYTFKTIDLGYTVIKCDTDYNFEACYLITHASDKAKRWVCSCPASTHSNTCKHLAMRDLFEKRKRMDKPWWYNWARQEWVRIRPE